MRKALRAFRLAGLSKVPYNPMSGQSVPIDIYAQYISAEMRVVEEYKDYVKCINESDSEGFDENGKIAGAVTFVAKPHYLRNSTFDGQTRGTVTFATAGVNLLTATDPAYSYTEHLICTPYAEDDKIRCLFVRTNIQTDIIETGETVPQWIEWEDLNNSGRAWMMGADY